MKFAANLSMMFTEHGFLDRFDAAEKAGFSGVEYLFPYDWPAQDLASRLKMHGLQQVLFNMPPGNWDAGERGISSLPGRETEFAENIEKAVSYTKILNPPRVHCMAGLRVASIAMQVQRAAYVTNLRRAAEAFAEIGVDVLVEPINPHDIPGYFLNDFGLALEIIDEVNRDSARPAKLQFDIYHCQRIHGDVPGWLEKCRDHTAHLQIAGTQDRHEPDHGNLPLEPVMEAARALHPDLWIGCEYRPAARTEDGLGWLKRYQR